MKLVNAAAVFGVSLIAFTGFAGRVVSVNIADGTSGLVSGSTEYGLAPDAGDNWINVTETSPNPFAVDLGNGVTATFSSTGSFGRYKPDGVLVEDQAPYLKRYIDDNAGKITVTVTGLKFFSYELIVYLGADYGYNDSEGDFQPISVNSVWYGGTNDVAVACGEKDYWGSYGTGHAEAGVNTLRIPGLLGSTLTFTIPSRHRRSCLSAFQIVESNEKVKVIPGAISVNFGAQHGASEFGPLNGLAGGLIMAESWNNLSDGSGETALKVWYGDGMTNSLAEASDVTLTWSSAGTYHYTRVQDMFLAGYLEDNSTPSITVANIPWDEYDLIVYAAADWGGVTYGSWEGPDFNPVNVNGTKYTWSEAEGRTVATTGNGYWGEFGHQTATLGVNALRITGLSGSTLTFDIGHRFRRGGVAAFQIVQPLPADLVATGDVTTKEINRLAEAGEEFSVELPSGSRLVLGKQPLVCSKLTVICSGDVILDTDHEPVDADEAEWAKVDATSRVSGLVFHGWLPYSRVVSVNVYSEKGAMSAAHSFAGAFAGTEISSDSWNDMPASNMTGSDFSPRVWNGESCSVDTIDGLKMSWDFVNTYGWGSSPDAFRRGWLTHGSFDWSIAFSGIPFEKYDVICYFNWDGSDAFRANKINDVYYIGGEDGMAVESVSGGTWGLSSHSAAAELGVNAYRLNDLTSSTLTLSGGWMANLCALQIVEHARTRRYLNPLVITIR